MSNWAIGSLGTFSTYSYINDAVGRRTNVVHSGAAFAATHNFQWGYNDRSELTAADRYEGTTQETHTGAPFAFDYAYDNIGNRKTYNVNNAQTPDEITYTANDLNQYGSTTSPAESFAYDDDGNLILDGQFVYIWDAENRLIEVQTRIDVGASSTAYETGDKHVYFSYD